MAVNDFISEQQCEDILSYVKTKQFTEHGALVGDAVSSHNPNDLVTDLFDISTNVLSCKSIFWDIEKLVKEYSEDSGYSGSYIVNSWINIQKEGSILIEHAHPQSCISGALYLKVDDKSSNLYFKTPNPFIYYSMMTEQHRTEVVVPKNGSLIMFPSWLVHGSNNTENMSEERIVLSFNCK
jgi:uncharacterized protein (TIGR02466 family)